MFKNITIIALALLLSGCPSSFDRLTKDEQNSSTYSIKQTGKFSKVTEGRIISIKEVNLAGSKALGTAFGSVLGGIAGASTTDKKHSKSAAIAIGALAGAILGSAVEESVTKDTAYEFLIKTKFALRAFVDVSKQGLRVGDEVYIIHGNGPVRISRK